MPKINGNEIKPGFVLDHDGGLWAAVKVNHVKPGKGGANGHTVRGPAGHLVHHRSFESAM